MRGEKKGERSVFRRLKGLRRSDARKRTKEKERRKGNVNSEQKRRRNEWRKV